MVIFYTCFFHCHAVLDLKMIVWVTKANSLMIFFTFSWLTVLNAQVRGGSVLLKGPWGTTPVVIEHLAHHVSISECTQSKFDFSVPACHHIHRVLVLSDVLCLNFLLEARSIDSKLTGMVMLLAGYAESGAITGLILSTSALFLSWPLSSLLSCCGAEQGWYHCCQHKQAAFPSQGHMNR